MLVSYMSGNYAICENFVGFRVIPMNDATCLTNYILRDSERILVGIRGDGNMLALCDLPVRDGILDSSSFVHILFKKLCDNLVNNTTFVDLNELTNSAFKDAKMLKDLKEKHKVDDNENNSESDVNVPSFLRKRRP